LGVSINLAADFCLETVQEAIVRNGKSGIFNTDQGSQFTSLAFTDLLQDHTIGSVWMAGEPARQRLRRTAVALGQIRGDKSAGL
jgi:transposase InsO family protein